MLKRTLVACIALCFLATMAPSAFAANKTHIMLITSLGNIELVLDSQKAPVSTKNFINYVNSSYYNDTIFHRVILGFIVQGGGFMADMQQKSTHTPIRNESDNVLRNLRGTISMARTANKDSATSQFFLNVAHNSFLDHGQRDFGYAVFGKVVKGMDVVDKISQALTGNIGPHQNVPTKPILILSAKVVLP